MKWLQRTAQGFNPGLAGQVECPEDGARDSERFVGSKRECRKHVPRAPLFLLRPDLPANYGGQAGGYCGSEYPGLKPWAVLLDHFVAKKFPLRMDPN